MHVTRPTDLALLASELAAAGVPFDGLGRSGTDDDGELYTYDGIESVDLPPEARPVVDAHDAAKPTKTAAFEQAEDQERVRLVNERALTDPAYAALADLALGKDR